MSAKRIAIWWQQDSWGGVESHLLTLLRNWPEGEDRFVIFHNRSNPGADRLSVEFAKLANVSMVAFADPPTGRRFILLRVLRYFALPLRFLALERQARQTLMANGSFDALLSNNGGYPAAWSCLAALWSARRLGVPKRVLLVHHAAVPRTVFRVSFEHLVDLGVQRWATDLVSVSRATRQTLIERRGFDTEFNPIRVIHNGADAPPPSADDDVALRKLFSIGADELLVGMLGRVQRYKGHEDLILAIADLDPSERRRVRAVFVGFADDSEQSRLSRLAGHLGIADRIIFTGYLAGAPGTLIKQLDVLAMLTKDFEGFGLTIAEALHAGTPVLATAVGAVPEFVSLDVAMLVPPESPRAVAAALHAFLVDPAGARQRAHNAAAHIRNFSGAVMARDFHRLLEI